MLSAIAVQGGGRLEIAKGAFACLRLARLYHTQSVQQIVPHGSGSAWVAPSGDRESAKSSGDAESCPRGKVLKLFDGLLQQRTQPCPAAAALTERLQSSESASTSRTEARAAKEANPPAAAFLSHSAPTDVKLESYLVFQRCLSRFLAKHGTDFSVPREIVWLNGAPGSGKGVNTANIMQTRGCTESICMSTVLATMPESRKVIDAGEMISDAMVCDMLLEAALGPRPSRPPSSSIVVDGFPRTSTQVDFLKLLHDQLLLLHNRYVGTDLAPQFPRPSFKVVMLYVDEATSTARQVARAVAVAQHNARVREAAGGDCAQLALRTTDLSREAALKRYQIFRAHYPAILRLKTFFPFHLIDAMGSTDDTQAQIEQELRYQSGLDLGEATYGAVRHLPQAHDLSRSARAELVGRLDSYTSRHPALFTEVLALLEGEVVPLLREGGLSGRAEWASGSPVFARHPEAVGMVVDVLSDRGFTVHCVREAHTVPVRFDAATGAITSEARPLHRFVIGFEPPAARGQLKAMEIAARLAEAARGGGAAEAPLRRIAPVTMSFVPRHLAERGGAAAASVGGVATTVLPACSSGDAACMGGAPTTMQLHPRTLQVCTHPHATCGHAREVDVLQEAAAGGA